MADDEITGVSAIHLLTQRLAEHAGFIFESTFAVLMFIDTSPYLNCI